MKRQLLAINYNNNTAGTAHRTQLQALMTASVIQLHSVEAQLAAFCWVEGL